jgi:hypothetical protein
VAVPSAFALAAIFLLLSLPLYFLLARSGIDTGAEFSHEIWVKRVYLLWRPVIAFSEHDVQIIMPDALPWPDRLFPVQYEEPDFL